MKEKINLVDQIVCFSLTENGITKNVKRGIIDGWASLKKKNKQLELVCL